MMDNLSPALSLLKFTKLFYSVKNFDINNLYIDCINYIESGEFVYEIEKPFIQIQKYLSIEVPSIDSFIKAGIYENKELYFTEIIDNKNKKRILKFHKNDIPNLNVFKIIIPYRTNITKIYLQRYISITDYPKNIKYLDGFHSNLLTVKNNSRYYLENYGVKYPIKLVEDWTKGLEKIDVRIMEIIDGKLVNELIPPKWGGSIKIKSVNNQLNMMKWELDIEWLSDFPPHSHKNYGIFFKKVT